MRFSTDPPSHASPPGAPSAARVLAPPGAERFGRAALLAAGLVAAAHAALFWSLDALPFQDVPNHLARSVIIADLRFHAGRRFGDAFAFVPRASSYLLGDLALSSLVERFGPYVAGRLWVLGVWASLPAAVAVYLRSRRYAAPSIVLASVLALYVGTDWTFLSGFLAFRLGIAVTLVALAAWERVLETGAPGWYLAYAACVAVGWLTHLSTVVMIGAAAAATGLLALRAGKAPLGRVAAGALPLLAAAGWEAAMGGLATGPAVVVRDAWPIKLKRILSLFHRYDHRAEAPLYALYAIVHALLLARWRAAWRGSERARTAAVLAAVFLAMYLVLPMSRGYVAWIDCRALPFAALFTLFAALAVAEESGVGVRAATVAALALAALNVSLLAAHLLPSNDVMRAYREVAAQVPAGATVLPVPTRPQDGATNPFLHAGCFAIIEAGANTPYLFAGGVTPHFQRRHALHAPSELWYQERRGGPVVERELEEAARTYPFVLWEKPYDAGRGPFGRTEVIAESGAAALVRLRGARPSPVPRP